MEFVAIESCFLQLAHESIEAGVPVRLHWQVYGIFMFQPGLPQSWRF
jgi:hypothetical protein